MAELRARPPYSYRDDPTLPRFDDGTPLAIADGDCKLCATGGPIIARLNREHVFRIGGSSRRTALHSFVTTELEPHPESGLFLRRKDILTEGVHQHEGRAPGPHL